MPALPSMGELKGIAAWEAAAVDGVLQAL